MTSSLKCLMFYGAAPDISCDWFALDQLQFFAQYFNTVPYDRTNNFACYLPQIPSNIPSVPFHVFCFSPALLLLVLLLPWLCGTLLLTIVPPKSDHPILRASECPQLQRKQRNKLGVKPSTKEYIMRIKSSYT